MTIARHRDRSGDPVVEVGFFGKLRTHGDFVSNRFDRRLRERLDAWLQRSISDSRRALGNTWPAAFAAMPVWRFVLGRDVGGDRPVMGVMTASVDRVGRQFPFILAARPERYRGPTRALCGEDDWFGAAEELARSARDGTIALDGLDAALAALPPQPAGYHDDAAKAEHDRSFWWTAGADGRAPMRFAAVGLPAPAEFRRLLGNGTEPAAPAPVTELAAEFVAPRFFPARPPKRYVTRAAGASHAGTRLGINADAWLSRDRGDLHVVVDGLGTSPAAAEAARLVTDRLGQIPPADTLDDLIQHVKGALGRVGAILRAGAATGQPPAAASIAALLTAPDGFAAIWAGDARCYLLRDGMMRGLTRDHVEVGLRRRLFRCIGGEAQNSVEVVRDALRPADRFLLCSAPLVRALSERAIATTLALPPAEAADALVQDALIVGVADNVTAVAVHVHATADAE